MTTGPSVIMVTGYPISKDTTPKYVKRIDQGDNRLEVVVTEFIDEAQLFHFEVKVVIELLTNSKIWIHPAQTHAWVSSHLVWSPVRRVLLTEGVDTLTMTLMEGAAHHPTDSNDFIEGIDFTIDTLARVGLIDPTLKDKITEQLHAIELMETKRFLS